MGWKNDASVPEGAKGIVTVLKVLSKPDYTFET